MNKTRIEQIKKNINTIDVELIHEGYLDGWLIKYLKEKRDAYLQGLVKIQKELGILK